MNTHTLIRLFCSQVITYTVSQYEGFSWTLDLKSVCHCSCFQFRQNYELWLLFSSALPHSIAHSL